MGERPLGRGAGVSPAKNALVHGLAICEPVNQFSASDVLNPFGPRPDGGSLGTRMPWGSALWGAARGFPPPRTHWFMGSLFASP